MNNKEKISGIIILYLYLCLVLVSADHRRMRFDIEELEDRITKLRMGEEIQYFNRNAGRIYGVYRANEYYCVWVKDRRPDQIYNVTIHEQCHDLIYLDPVHFCGGKI